MKTSIGFRLGVTICAAILFVGAFSFMSAPTRAEGAAERARKAAETAVAKAVAARKCRELEEKLREAEEWEKVAEARKKKTQAAVDAAPNEKNSSGTRSDNREAAKALARAHERADKLREEYAAIKKPCDDPEKTAAEAGEALKKAEDLLAEKIEESGDKDKPPKKLVEEKKKLDDLRKDLYPGTIVPTDAGETGQTKTTNGLRIATTSYDATPGPGYVGTFQIATNGLRIVTFDTSAGRLNVNLPDDMTAGDTISGTVVAEPKGNTNEERAKNSAELSGYVVELRPPVMANTSNSITGDTAKNQTPPRALLRSMDGGASWQVIDSLNANFTLRLDQGPGLIDVCLNRLTPQDPLPGRTLVVTTIPNDDFQSRMGAPTGAPGSRTGLAERSPDIEIQREDVHWVLPQLAQQGRPMVIYGPFDGDFSNTSLRSSVEKNTGNVSGGFALLAESPRKAVFDNSTNVTGPIQITLKEGNKETKGTYRNVGVNLTAPKTSLLKGEKTELKIEASGLQGIKEPVPLTLESKGVITMEGGMYQPLVIQPSQVGADGRYSTTRGITGVQAGGWSATATVVTHRFNVCLQDDSNPANVILWNTFTGDYSFNCHGCLSSKQSGTPSLQTGRTQTGGQTQTGRTLATPVSIDLVDPGGNRAVANVVGKVEIRGCIFTLEHGAPDRRVFATLDVCANSGSGTVEVPKTDVKFTITDRNTRDNTCAVQ